MILSKKMMTFLLLAATTVGHGAQLQPPSEVVYTQDKTSVAVTADHPSFKIKLKSNPTTGYSWFLREFHPHYLEPVHHHFQPDNSNRVGAPGFEVWTFRAKPEAFIVPQQTIIRFVSARPWESQGQVRQVVFRVYLSSH